MKEFKSKLVKLAESGKVPVRIIISEERGLRAKRMENSIQEGRYKQAKSAQSAYDIIVRSNYTSQNNN